MDSLLDVIGRDTQLKRVASTHGGEYAGACPMCGGTDRLRAWPDDRGGRWWCRQCDKGGDVIAYEVEIGRMTPTEAYRARHGDQVTPSGAPRTLPAPQAPEPTEPPDKAWQERAWEYVARAQFELWSDSGARALAWLLGRGLTDDAIQRAGLGYDPGDAPAWRCITIPWFIGGDLWAVRRRFPAWSKDEPGMPSGKFMMLKGSDGHGLYNADALRADLPAILVEGELDVCSIAQAAGDLVVAVATGGISQARRARWVARLAVCPLVVVAFDAGNEAEPARRWWLDALPNARYWKPYWDDANGLLQGGALRDWIAAGLGMEVA